MFNLIWSIIFFIPWLISFYIIAVILMTIYDVFFKESLKKMNDKYFNDKP